MAKAQGIIGNFKGKIGNTVGYQLTSSNNKQTQGIRIYQPNVKNPKTSAQAEQRAKLAPINATYRALKMIIDRGNEGLPYGNKSRLAWLKKAFKSETMPWYVKGAPINAPVCCELTRGSLAGLSFESTDDGLKIICKGVTGETGVKTVGALSTALKAAYPTLQDGDQITLVQMGTNVSSIGADILSFVIDTTSQEAISGFSSDAGAIIYDGGLYVGFNAAIVSREGTNGEHLRSTTHLLGASEYVKDEPYDEKSKTAAIKSYMSSGVANADWEQEPID